MLPKSRCCTKLRQVVRYLQVSQAKQKILQNNTDMELDNARNTNLLKFLFVLNLLTVTFWFVVQNIDIYHYAIVGAIFEILWLPMIIIIFLLPLLSLYFWFKDKFKINSKFLYLLLFSLSSIGTLYILTK